MEVVQKLKHLTESKGAPMENVNHSSFDSFSNVLPDAIFTLDKAGKFISTNPAATSITGYSSTELLSMGSFKGILLPSEVAKVESYFMKSLAGESHEYETIILNKSGVEVFLHVYSFPNIVNEQVVGVFGVAKDITERKHAEDGVRSSEDRFRNLFHTNQSIKLIIDAQSGQILDANDAAIGFYGYDKKKLLSLKISDINTLPPEEVEREMEKAKLEERKHFYFKHRLANGDVRDVEVYTAPSSTNGKRELFSIIYDITERKKAEESLNFQSQIMTNIAEGVYLIRVSDGTIVYANSNFEKMFGYDHDELIGKEVSIVNAPTEKTPNETKEDIMAILEETGIWRGEVQNIKKDGTHFWCYANVSVFLHPSFGKVLISVHTDITERKNAENSKNRFGRMVEKSSNEIYLFNSETLLFVEVNQCACKNLGYTMKELEKLTPLDIKPEHTKQTFLELVKPLREGSLDILTFETVHQRKDGTIYPVEVRLNYFDSEMPTLFIAIIQDITDRKMSEEALKNSEIRFRNTFEQAAVGIAHVSPNGSFIMVNNRFCEIVGYTKEEMQTHTFQDITHPDDLSIDLENLKEMLSGEIQTYTTEKRYIRKDKSLIWVDLTVALVSSISGTPEYFISVVEDITERKRAEDEIIEAKVKAEQATKLKDKFVSLVSHDLQSPLATMNGFLKLILDDEAEIPNEGVKKMLSGAIDTGNKMSALIDDLLSISRLRTGALKPKLKFIDAKQIGLKMVVDFEFLAQRKGIVITSEIPIYSRIYADISLLTEAVQNLITNSMKFCKKGDSITIYISDNDESTICVRDTGVGIKAEFLDKIFEYGGKTSTNGTDGEGGTGLGLPFAKEIVEAHGGELNLESEEGKGCLVKIKLPHVKPRVLLVDDDPQFRLLQRYYLKALDVDIVEAENGVEALNEVETNLPHLIISDIEMPEMNGLELVKRLQSKKDTRSIPIIVVSGVHGMEIRDEVFGLGAKDFVTKSAGDVELVPRVKRFVF